MSVLIEKLISDKSNCSINFEIDFSKAVSYITWARFRHTSELQIALLTKLKEMFNACTKNAEVANAYTHIIKTIFNLSSDINTIESFSDYYDWALDIAKHNNLNLIIDKLSKYIYDEDFIVFCPSNNIPNKKPIRFTSCS